MGCVELAAKHESFAKLGNESVVRLDDRVRRLKAGREQGGVRRIVHRVIGAAASAFGLFGLQKQPRLVQSSLGLPHVIGDEGGVSRHSRNPSRLMFAIKAGLLNRSGC